MPRYNAEEKAEMVERLRNTDNKARTMRELGISKNTMQRWLTETPVVQRKRASGTNGAPTEPVNKPMDADKVRIIMRAIESLGGEQELALLRKIVDWALVQGRLHVEDVLLGGFGP